MWNRFKRWVISIHLDVRVNHLNWPAALEPYATVFGRRVELSMERLPDFPRSIEPAEGESINSKALGEIVGRYRIHRVNIFYSKSASADLFKPKGEAHDTTEQEENSDRPRQYAE